MSIVLATIRDMKDGEVGRVEADRGENDLQIRLIDSQDQWRAGLENIVGRLTLMINGVLCLEQVNGGDRRLVFFDDVIAETTGGALRLAYVLEGIEAAHQLRRQIARQQVFSVPFADLQNILHRSLSK